MCRKSLLTGLCAMGCFLFCHAQINIWEGTSNKRVELTPYLVPGKSHTAFVVCPGGSYFWHDMKTEGEGVARWLNENGISAFVLKYRTASVPAYVTHFRWLFRGNRYPDPQDDLRQALCLIRAKADSFGIDKEKLGVMGFSAGGHLALSAGELFEEDERPYFIAAIYPVVSMSAPCTHKRSRRALLGEKRKGNHIMQDSLSLEKHVSKDCPPVFLVHCHDDPVVHYHNSELLDSALTSNGVPHKYLQYKTGGHGFGASDHKGSKESVSWKREFINWLKTYVKETI